MVRIIKRFINYITRCIQKTVLAICLLVGALLGAQIAHLEHVFQQEITHQKEFWNTIKVNSANASPQICLECDMLLYPNTFREEGRSILTPKLMMHYGSPAFLKTIQYSSPLVSTLTVSYTHLTLPTTPYV